MTTYSKKLKNVKEMEKFCQTFLRMRVPDGGN